LVAGPLEIGTIVASADLVETTGVSAKKNAHILSLKRPQLVHFSARCSKTVPGYRSA
jgi:hypothetical protein